MYNQEFYEKLKKETINILHFLQKCKFAGSIDTRFDVNILIRIITNYQVLTKNLIEDDIKKLTDKNTKLEYENNEIKKMIEEIQVCKD